MSLDDHYCELCKKKITRGEFVYSVSSYLKRSLCIWCQMDEAERLAKSDNERNMVRIYNEAKRKKLGLGTRDKRELPEKP